MMKKSPQYLKTSTQSLEEYMTQKVITNQTMGELIGVQGPAVGRWRKVKEMPSWVGVAIEGLRSRDRIKPAATTSECLGKDTYSAPLPQAQKRVPPSKRTVIFKADAETMALLLSVAKGLGSFETLDLDF